MRFKGLLAAALSSVFLCGVSAYADNVNVSVNGKTLDTEAVIADDRTLVPLRAVSNALGCGVAWNDETKGITMFCKTDTAESFLVCWIGKNHAFRMDSYGISGSSVMDVLPQIINDRTYVPVRAVSELFGADVSWNDELKTADIILSENTSLSDDEIANKMMWLESAIYNMYDEYSSFVDGTCEKINAEIDLENGGKIMMELYPQLAPVTVSNFVKLAESGYYNGLIFHRVIKDFMIQGGGYDINGSSPHADSIVGEFIANGRLNLIPHDRGTVSMARTSVYDSASGQFFIVHGDSNFLDGEYASFGKVVSGMEYVDEIANMEVDANDKPMNNAVIKEVIIK